MAKTKAAAAITTFLGGETAIEGTINFDGIIRLDGRVSGKIISREGTVIVGDKAVVEGDISVGVAIIMGRVNGLIEAASRIEVSPPAVIDGDIRAPVISIDAGVQFNGNCTMTSRNTAGNRSDSADESPNDSFDDREKLKVKNFPKNL